MRIRYTRRARTDIESVFAYLHERSPRAAAAVVGAIEDAIAMLAQFPAMAPETDEPGVRELTIVRYPYKVYYETDDNELRILHVRDARRRPWLESERR
jgi:plasmid stabilization system protein ParE